MGMRKGLSDLLQIRLDNFYLDLIFQEIPNLNSEIWNLLWTWRLSTAKYTRITMDPHEPTVTWPHVIKTAPDQGNFPHSLRKPGDMSSNAVWSGNNHTNTNISSWKLKWSKSVKVLVISSYGKCTIKGCGRGDIRLNRDRIRVCEWMSVFVNEVLCR